MVHYRSEQYFGSPSDMASSAENIRDKMKLVEARRLQQEKGEQPEEQEEEDFETDPQHS